MSDWNAPGPTGSTPPARGSPGEPPRGQGPPSGTPPDPPSGPPPGAGSPPPPGYPPPAPRMTPAPPGPPTGWDAAPTGSAPVAAGWGGAPPPPSGPAFGAGRPGVGDVIETMFRVYRATFPTTAAVMAILLLPGLVLLGVGFLQMQDLFSVFLDAASFDPTASGLPSVTDAQLQAMFTNPVFWIAVGLGGLLALLGQMAATPALMKVGVDELGGGAPRIGSAVRLGFRRMWGIAGVWILLFLLLAVVFLLPVPLLFLDGRWGLLFILTVPVGLALLFVVIMVGYLVAATVVVEDIGALPALGRARTLLRASFWPTFGRGMLVGLLVTIIGWVLGAANQLSVLFGPELFLAVTVLVNALGYLVSTPLGVFGGLALYGDLRVRTEGTDVLRAAGRLER